MSAGPRPPILDRVLRTFMVALLTPVVRLMLLPEEIRRGYYSRQARRLVVMWLCHAELVLIRGGWAVRCLLAGRLRHARHHLGWAGFHALGLVAPTCARVPFSWPHDGPDLGPDPAPVSAADNATSGVARPASPTST